MRYLFILLLICSIASAGDLDSTEAVRAQVYSILNLDTTGTNDLPTGTVDGYVNYAIQEANEDLTIYKRIDSVFTSSGVRYYALDSCIRLISVVWDSANYSGWIHVIQSQQAIDSAFGVANITQDDFPEHIYKWSDSVGFTPVPNGVDTFLVNYNHIIPADGISFLPADYRLGVLYYAAFLGALDVDLAKADKFMMMYNNFVGRKRGTPDE